MADGNIAPLVALEDDEISVLKRAAAVNDGDNHDPVDVTMTAAAVVNVLRAAGPEVEVEANEIVYMVNEYAGAETGAPIANLQRIDELAKYTRAVAKHTLALAGITFGDNMD